MDVEKVIEHFGSTRKTAEALLVSYQSVQHWRNDGEIPPVRQFQIEVLTNGKFKATAKPHPMSKKLNG